MTNKVPPVPPANATKTGCRFAEWHFRKQADKCAWAGYDAKAAAVRDAILYQTDDKNLMKIIYEDLNFDDIVRYGLAMKQESHKMEQMRNQTS